MADPAPSAPLPDAAPERRVSPADQMAALTGEPVEISQPEDDEPAEDRDASTQTAQIEQLSRDGALQTAAPTLDALATIHRNPPAPTPSDSARRAGLASRPDANLRPRLSRPAITPLPQDLRAVGAKPQQDRQSPSSPLPESPGPSERGLAKPAGRGAAERGSDGRRRPDRRSPSPRAACPGRSRRGFQGCNFQRRSSSDARAPTPSLLDRLAVKSILDNLRRPEAKAPAPQSAPTPGATPPPPPQPRLRRTPRRRPLPLPAVSATSLASSPPTACKRGATRKRSRAPPRPGPLFLPRWRRWNGRRRPGSS